MIPKIIHYCWYGNGNKSKYIKECMDTWGLCDDYIIQVWNEENCDLNINSFVKEMVKRKKWAFVSDYFRLYALYHEGGIYLDTDVELQHKFDDLLSYEMFLGFIFDSSIGTAVIGCEKHHPFILKLLNLYNTAWWDDECNCVRLKEYPELKFVNNNSIFSYLLKMEYEDFKLNGKFQKLSNIVVFPKEEFEIGPIFGKKHALHRCEASWKSDKDSLKKKSFKYIKRMAANLPFINGESLIRHISYSRKISKEAFYDIYLTDKKSKNKIFK